ncbi:hypothetical protein A9G36_08790 [Gilliamella sp. Choc6-1]|nr:hypothetical protein A9G36_08790 [Gilliamella apicola]
MRELQQILTGTLIYSTQRKKDLPPPTFTDRDLKEGLRRSWTAEQIGHLLVKYESEWYADEELSKWNEIDNLYEQEKQQKKEIIEEELNKLGLTLPYQRDFAMKKVDEAHEHVKSNWQLEKEERIKPSLWWKKVAQAQAQNQTTSTEQSEANTPKLSNLSADGKAWFIHPVAMMDYFNVIKTRTTFDEKYIPEDNEVYINVIVPSHRGLEGPLIVFDRSEIYFKTHALCLGTNTNRTKASGDGDTPTGRTKTTYYPNRHKGEWSFGNYGFIELIGDSGEFLTATKNGRDGIGIHSGHTSGYYRKSLEDLGNLMNTHGCIRVYNEAMKELGALYTRLKSEGKTIYCYIEDYVGDIKDVYEYYGLAPDPKDTVRKGRVKTQ